jgi:hypothetical protein
MLIMPTGIYTITLDATAVSAARTLVQYNAPSTRIAVVLRAWVSQCNSEVATQEEIQLLRVTTAGTGTGATPRPTGSFAAAAGTATVNNSAEGTAGDSLHREGFEIRNGWLWIPTPEERFIIPPSGRIALKFPAAPEASIDVSAGLVVAELG